MRTHTKRAIVIVLDGVGAGALPDASAYGDKGANTLANIAKATGGLRLPNLAALGLGNIIRIDGVGPARQPRACFGKMREASAGKDTISGHWELMGIVTEKPFPLYPKGFPAEIIEPLERQMGRRILGNKPASGTEIIADLGVEHMRTGHPIVYTSADSVFQIAAHEDIISVDELYHICESARKLLVGRHRVSRVIARPFAGKAGRFARTARRRDFSIAPPKQTVLHSIKTAGMGLWSVGKISEMFPNVEFDESWHGEGNMSCLDHVLKLMRRATAGLIFANLVDFDTLWGHRNDVENYAKGLAEVDARMPQLLSHLRPTDLLIVTADHGCDPTAPGTDHTREYVPVLAYSKKLGSVTGLGTRKCFGDVGKTVVDHLGVRTDCAGASFLRRMGLGRAGT